MIRRFKESLGTKAVVIGVVTTLLGGGAALALPDEAVSGQETAATNKQVAQDKALAAQETAAAHLEAVQEKAPAPRENADVDEGDLPNQEIADGLGEGVPEVVQIFLAELETWVSCIQDGAAAHAEQQSNEETRIEDDEYDEADKLALCGEKPVNPNDDNEDVEEGDRPEDAGPPDEVGPPEDAGPPEGAGPPEDAGRPEGAGPPEHAGPPEDAGPPHDIGQDR